MRRPLSAEVWSGGEVGQLGQITVSTSFRRLRGRLSRRLQFVSFINVHDAARCLVVTNFDDHLLVIILALTERTLESCRRPRLLQIIEICCHRALAASIRGHA